MTRHIIVAITPDEDGVRCGECEMQAPSSETAYCHCELTGEELQGHRDYGAVRKRGPLCLAAERKLAAIVEAGEDMLAAWDEGTIEHEAWDRAVAEVRK